MPGATTTTTTTTTAMSSAVTPTLNLPPSDESATFQHSPSGPLKREWEPGCQPDEVYDKYLSPWRAASRRWLVKRLRDEKDWFANMQAKVRTPARDTYFYWTAIFGTHMFFVALLPMFFFFYNPVKGRSLLYIVSLGVYVSSFAKDLVCTPRPYSPPVIRLSMSTHHNEYGFPSSHSTNTVSIALFFAQLLWEGRESAGTALFVFGALLNVIYVLSVVGGRLYTGMHSTMDVVGGCLMGVGCWAFWIVMQDMTESWVNSGTILVPAISIPLTLALVHLHPEPIDDCPCFEDAISVLSCSMGSFVGHWYIAQGGLSHMMTSDTSIFRTGMIVGGFIAGYRIVLGESRYAMTKLRSSQAGLGVMMTFRMFTKAGLLRVLPPAIRLAARGFNLQLTTRKFYKAATDYREVPHSDLRPVPSFVNLHQIDQDSPSTDDTPADSGSSTPALHVPTSRRSSSIRSASPIDTLRQRHNLAKIQEMQEHTLPLDPKEIVWVPKRRRKSKAERAKYDAEVLTKVGVYAGLGYLATTTLPLLFGYIETELFSLPQ